MLIRTLAGTLLQILCRINLSPKVIAKSITDKDNNFSRNSQALMGSTKAFFQEIFDEEVLTGTHPTTPPSNILRIDASFQSYL